MPDSERVYFLVQDRAQTWLDINTASRSGGEPKRLLRETTEAFSVRFAIIDREGG